MKRKLFIIVVILMLGSLLFNTSCRTIEEFFYTLNGSWWFDLEFYGGGFESIQISCTGGIAYDDTYGGVGTYSQIGSDFNITITWVSATCGNGTDIYYGTFLDVNTLSGTFSWVSDGCIPESGTFIATRQ